ncbi:MAG: sigma-70 family RNA polymerase sigma factor [Gammaproteobacteria bacterium]
MSRPDDDPESDGNAELIARLFGQYSSKLLVYCRRFSPDAHERQDMVQETWLDLLQNEVDFLTLRKPWAYIRKVAQSVAARHFERRSRDRVVSDPRASDDATEDTTQETTEDSLTMPRDELPGPQALMERLEEAREALPTKLRAVLELDLQGWSNQEIAEECALTKYQVERRLTDARRRLKSILSDAKQGRTRT